MIARRVFPIHPLVVGLGFLTACSSDVALARFVRPEDDAVARAYFDSIRTGRVDYALAALGPQAGGIRGERDSLVRLAAYLPAGPLDSVHIIGVNNFRSSSVDRSMLTYEYHSDQGWGAVSIVTTGGPTSRFVEGIHATRLTQSFEQANAFTFQGKSAGHYLMLALVLVCFSTAVWVAVLALRTTMNRRWAWALLALVGAGTVMFNWTTGQVAFRLLNLLFLDAAFGRAGSAAAPWILQAAFPIGALMTWRRIQRARAPLPGHDAGSPSDTASAPTGSGDLPVRHIDTPNGETTSGSSD